MPPSISVIPFDLGAIQAPLLAIILRQGSSLAMGSLPDLRKLVSPGMWLEVQLLTAFENMDKIRGISGVLSLDVISEREVDPGRAVVAGQMVVEIIDSKRL